MCPKLGDLPRYLHEEPSYVFFYGDPACPFFLGVVLI